MNSSSNRFVFGSVNLLNIFEGSIMGPDAADEEALLRKDVEENYRSSLKLSASKPTRFTQRLRHHVYASKPLFCMGQFLESGREAEFLSTVAVLCCIVVFAWTKKGQQGPKGFGAHICLQNAMSFCGYRDPSKHTLQQLVHSLRACFTEVSPGDVEVHLVGGHEYSDCNSSLKEEFNGQKQRLSWHVIDAVKKAGFKNINQTMLNRFPGGPLEPSPMCEYRLVEANQRIAVAALHMETGHIVTHSHTASADHEIPPDWWAANDRAVSSISLLFPHPLQHASVKPHVLFFSYMILTAGILLWSTSLTWTAGALGALWLVKPQSLMRLCGWVMLAVVASKCLPLAWKCHTGCSWECLKIGYTPK